MIVAVLKCEGCQRDAIVRFEEKDMLFRWLCRRCGGSNYIQCTTGKFAVFYDPEPPVPKP